ncbi:hypothetical protein [Brevibacterium luteolum]|uniref:hypothetical protein n=1 Tax=Brevibacterium luteolum TaxID=199591 RepID=UPI00223C0B97|nr:hypothetical protein [Brevibacterium luteolum]MCT1657162.1 hypothetical protein [Brevibacterium luteolum]MCT1828655.1 hypothetical protein [Brevibacterium luteolum]MCT1874653.1 hypothetical protein [Brevibacterium luteolum]MCT1891772.1 hypothetical protein [Brevibacterium luteolum]MCT1894319.1 hypothetical protein [Brevibacterium luteolum]
MSQSAASEQTDVSGYAGISTAMLYDVARHTSSVLSAEFLARRDSSASEEDREFWASRRRLLKQQVRALDPEDRAVLIAQDAAWKDQIKALVG